MITLLLMIGVLCIWLSVGMIAYKKRTGRRPGRAFWAGVAVLTPVAYVASFVFLVLLDGKGLIPDSAREILGIFYAPIGWIIDWTLSKLGIELNW